MKRSWNFQPAFLVLAVLLSFATPSAFPEHEVSIPDNVVEVGQGSVDETHARIYKEGLPPSPTEPLKLEKGPHLFLDDYLIAASERVERVVEKPQRDPKIPNPVVTGPEDGCFQPYLSVIQDPETRKFRIWYGSRTADSDTMRSRIGVLESADGIEWERPHRILEDPAPIQFGVAVIDEGPDFATPEQRYKYAWHMYGGLMIATSPDGFHWTPLRNHPVARHSHDINGLVYDPIRDRYLATLSVYREGGSWDGRRRITMHTYSDNLIDWDPARYVLLPDPNNDEGETQFYAMDGYLARGDLLIGMVKVLRDDLKADDPPDPPGAYGVGYTSLAWTRDGKTWYRDPEHFFDPHPKKGEWDHAHAWIDEQVLVGDRVYLYYGGYKSGHKVNRFEERQIGLVTVPRDRYVARAAGDEQGRLTTVPLLLPGDRLTLNADASRGEIRVALIGKGGQPLEGFGFEDCQPLSEDSYDAEVRWGAPLSKVTQEPVSLAFSLRNARLYAIGLD